MTPPPFPHERLGTCKPTQKVRIMSAHRPRTERRATWVATAVSAVVLLLLASACGTKSDATSSSVDDAGLKAAKATVAKAAVRPTTISVSTPIDKPIPSGKKITFVSCGVEACAIQGPILAAAAAHLGWTVDQVATDGSPEKVQGAIESAIRNGSNAVILNAADKDAYAKQIADANKAGVEFVTCCSLATAGSSSGILYNTATSDQNAPIGDYLAAEVVSDSGGKANAVYVNISAFRILAKVGETFTAGMKKYCSTCTVGNLDIPLTSLGKDAPDRIVSYLRSHPKVNYIALSVSDALGSGLPAALKAAGLADKVKIVGQGGGSQNFSDLKAGAIESLVPTDTYAYDYLMIDALARKWAGVPLEATGPQFWLVKKDTAPADTSKPFPLVTDTDAQFTKLWGKS
ncbi:sugar ABC transporter substrate-binding protein [Nocardioides pocheonensis]|uniref:Sugar ABC transporter substrate-binding protein n=2 Tax=Nocardioides pocheonensis TaxID=661485 RepID=A0A3N0GZ63_9ACTN|nr:sugar ABC transporter substrate-binding protein [Nocardioides pocheonensis]